MRESKLDEEFDEDKWRRSAKGQQEKDWWLNRCHTETEDRWPDHTEASYDAEKSIIEFGKCFVDNETDRPIEINYVHSLIKSWGQPLNESEEGHTVYQVVKDTDIHSSLGEDVSNQEPTVVTEHDCELCAKDKAEELNMTVTPGEKEVLGTEYKVQKKELKESKKAPDKEQQRQDIEDFVKDHVDDYIVKPYVYDHDVTGLAKELAFVTDYLTAQNPDMFIEQYDYEPDWDLFTQISEDYVQEVVGELTYKEGFEDLNELFCQELEESIKEENKDKLTEAVGSQEEEDIRDWVYSTIDDWRTSWDDDREGAELAKNDLNSATDWFLNNLDEFEELYGYSLDTDSEEYLTTVSDAYVDEIWRDLSDSWDHFNDDDLDDEEDFED